MTAPATPPARPRVFIHEVALRDGLQNEPNFLPTEQKIALANALARTGIAKLEVTSFVSPKAIPNLRDAEEVLRAVERIPGVLYVALVPNLRGAERALVCAADELNLVMSCSETHNLMNLRATREQSFAQLSEVIAFARPAGVRVNVSLSCCFGCPVEGEVPPDEVLRWAGRLLELEGVHGVAYCDTTGMSYPRQVHDLCAEALRRWPEKEATLHIHNTRGLGIAGALAALDAGITRFDASLGGLGGCPYAPGATGNVCTEDLVHAFELQGYDTATDLPALLTLSRSLPALLGHEVPGQVAKAGRRLDLHPAPAWLPEVRARALAKPLAA